jgi:hypothetical protein
MNFRQIFIFFCYLFLGFSVFQASCGASALAEERPEPPLFISWGSLDWNGAVGPWGLPSPRLQAISQPYAAAAAGAEQELWGYRWKGSPPANPDWRGIKRDTFYFVGYQFAAIAILYVAPESLSGWSQEDKDEYSLDKWWDNVSNPVWDEDKWWVNYVLHPYWGATYYIRARERGFDRLHSLWYSALLSTLYEYGAEALFEPVSIQDLIVTPVAGSLLGEYVFTPIREWIKSQPGELDWLDKVLLTATDPFGVINSGLDRIFRVKTSLSFQRLALTGYRPLPGIPDVAGDSMSTRNHTGKAWGLRMTIPW